MWVVLHTGGEDVNNGLLRHAWKSVLSNLKEVTVAIIAVSLGVATIVVLIAIGLGLYDVVSGQVAFSDAAVITISASGGFGPPGTDDVNPLEEELVQVVERVRGVDIAAGRYIRPGQVERGGETSTTFIASLPEDTRRQNFIVDVFDYEVIDGRNLIQGDTSIVVGSSLHSSERDPYLLRESLLLEDTPTRVVGLLEETESFQVDNSALVLDSFAKEIFDINNTFDIIVVLPSSPDNIAEVSQRIEDRLRIERGVEEGSEDFDVSTAEETVNQLQTVLTIVVAFVVSIGGISIVLGGLTLANTLFTIVSERSYEIGVMKSFGATTSQIKYLFIIESGAIGLVAGVIGTIMGVILTPILVYFLVNTLGITLLDYRLPLSLVIATPILSCFIGIISGYIPAKGAAKKDPVEVL